MRTADGMTMSIFRTTPISYEIRLMCGGGYINSRGEPESS